MTAVVEQVIQECVAAVSRNIKSRGGEPLSKIQEAAVEHVTRKVVEGFHEKLLIAWGKDVEG